MTETHRKKHAAKARKTHRENTRLHARASLDVVRDERGRWLKGVSPNPGGRPPEDRELRELARGHGSAAIAKLVQLMHTAEDERVQLGAAEALLTRGFGRPAEAASGPLVAINVGPGSTAPITNAVEAARVYAEVMAGRVDVAGIEFARALPVPASEGCTIEGSAIEAKEWHEAR